MVSPDMDGYPTEERGCVPPIDKPEAIILSHRATASALDEDYETQSIWTMH